MDNALLRRGLFVSLLGAFAMAQLVIPLCAQDAEAIEPAIIQPAPTGSPISNDRIAGVIPNFQTVSDPSLPVVPLTKHQKFQLFVKGTVDPFTFVSAAMGAAMSQSGDDTPKYGGGMSAYGQRFGAAYADMATQNFFSDALLASLLHEDPRYFRMGPEHSIPRRVVYALSRLVITRKDAGGERFNFSGVGGMAMGIGLSNVYYPRQSVSGEVTGGRFVSSVTGAALGNLLPEFWPDFKSKLDSWRQRHSGQ